VDKEFWHERWQARELGFHQGHPNALLVEYFSQLGLPPHARVFVPLCGKTRDIAWLLGQGCDVVGVELSQTAVEELFAELEIDPVIAGHGSLKEFSAANINIFVGDFFELTADLLGPVDAVYDRAALVALPDDMRRRYAAYLVQIAQRSPQLLLCFEYDQSQMDGPPFSVPEETVRNLYGDTYQLTQLATVDFPGGLKGQCPASECVWLLA
jgi:thiopurine S-methyltransferase